MRAEICGWIPYLFDTGSPQLTTATGTRISYVKQGG